MLAGIYSDQVHVEWHKRVAQLHCGSTGRSELCDAANHRLLQYLSRYIFLFWKKS